MRHSCSNNSTAAKQTAAEQKLMIGDGPQQQEEQ
jgi:hypothetical protein